MSSSISLVWFQKFAAPIEISDVNIPNIRKKSLVNEKSVKLQEIKKRVKQNNGKGAKIEKGVEHNLIIPKKLLIFIGK